MFSFYELSNGRRTEGPGLRGGSLPAAPRLQRRPRRSLGPGEAGAAFRPGQGLLFLGNPPPGLSTCKLSRERSSCRVPSPSGDTSQGRVAAHGWECHTPLAVLISLLIKQRHSVSGVTQMPAFDGGANKERMSVLDADWRRCPGFNWGAMSVFFTENVILSLARWGTVRTGPMGPPNPRSHPVTAVPGLCAP